MIGMEKNTTLSVSVNDEDKRVLRNLQKKLANIGHTAIFRLAIRALDRKLGKQ